MPELSSGFEKVRELQDVFGIVGNHVDNRTPFSSTNVVWKACKKLLDEDCDSPGVNSGIKRLVDEVFLPLEDTIDDPVLMAHYREVAKTLMYCHAAYRREHEHFDLTDQSIENRQRDL